MLSGRTVILAALAAAAAGATVPSPGAAQPAGTPWSAYVADFASGTVTPIDLATNTVGSPIDVGDSPAAIAITPDAATAYVARLDGGHCHAGQRRNQLGWHTDRCR